jgi:hypothetical protein
MNLVRFRFWVLPYIDRDLQIFLVLNYLGLIRNFLRKFLNQITCQIMEQKFDITRVVGPKKKWRKNSDISYCTAPLIFLADLFPQ